MSEREASSSFNEEHALVDLLTALEYGTRKEEQDVISPVLESYHLSHLKKAQLARQILKTPGFEPFFLDILKQVRPFSLMLGEVYAFLNSNETTTSRRASKVFVDSEKAKAQLEFDLQNFPKELLKTINQVDRFGSVIELRFDGINVDDLTPQWRNTPAESNWRAISPNWDMDFYDDGFHRTLSYGRAILSGATAEKTREAEGIVNPILDRLSAICDFIDGLLSADRRFFGSSQSFRIKPSPVELRIEHTPARSNVVRNGKAAGYLSRLSDNSWNHDVRTILDELYYELRAVAISANVWRDPTLRRESDDWIEARFSRNLSQISPQAYIEELRRLADDYIHKLDRVAPVVETYSYTETLERFIEFLSLPFWKHRWFLYELWTLTRTLEIARRVAPVELKHIEEKADGVLDWKLPGGAAQTPVAEIGDGPQRVYCWTQRKTYHPGTGAGLEPDLRLTTSAPSYHDILIIENKDRRTSQTNTLREILSRYVGGTCAESVWLVNYEQFPASAASLDTEWPERKVHILSNFRPGVESAAFEADIHDILRRNLLASPYSATGSTDNAQALSVDQLSGPQLTLEAKLTWGSSPRDLDLHAWVKNSFGEQHLSYSEKGTLDGPPYARLDKDDSHGSGEETIHIRTHESESTAIAVNNFSKEAPLSRSGATVTFAWASGQSVVLRVPETGSGDWWHVATVNHSNGEIQVISALSGNPPKTT